jgi:hypothetical protein
MLRASIEYHGSQGDLRAITEGSKSGDSGVLHGVELTAFAEAALQGDPASLATARDNLRAVAGSQAVVDAAGVIANFQRMVRIADGAGISLDAPVGMMSSDFREALGLESFASAERSRELSHLQRIVAPLLRRVANFGLRRVGRRSRR